VAGHFSFVANIPDLSQINAGLTNFEPTTDSGTVSEESSRAAPTSLDLCL
jgi:hypothetical protein